MRHVRLFLLSLMFSSSLCFAEASNYSFVQAGFNNTSLDNPSGPDIDFEGFDVKGSFQFAEDWYVTATYYDITTEDPIDIGGGTLADVDLDLLTVNLGYVFAKNEVGSLYGEVGFADAGISAAVAGATASDSESGVAAAIGVRANMGQRMEMRAGFNYVDVDFGDDTFFSGDLMWHFFKGLGAVDSISGVLSMTTGGDSDSFIGSIRVSF